MGNYKLFKGILSPIFKFWYKPTIIGKELIPEEGPIIIAGNHKHLFDQCLPIIATKRPIHYMAKKEYFDGKWAWFFKAARCIPVDRSKKDDKATQLALDVLNNGYALGIFPEGTRNRTNNLLLPFKYGAVSMAKKTNAYIVPFGISGEYKFRKNNLTVRFGEPFKVTGDLEVANKKLEKEVASLLNM